MAQDIIVPKFEKIALPAFQDGLFIGDNWTPHQYNWFYTPKKFVWLSGGAGSGKCLGKDTPVLMYDGSIKMVQDIVTGDQLMGWDSSPRSVLSTTTGQDTLYRIKPVKGDSWVCNSVHVLTLQDSVTKEIIDIPLNQYLEQKDTRKYRDKKLFRTGVDFKGEIPTLDPYFVGVWLGDGDINIPKITNNEPEILDYLKEFANSLDMRINHWTDQRNPNIVYTRINSVHVERNSQGHPMPNPVWQQLSGMTDGNDKWIEKEYLTASEHDRLELLAGLLDTDGHYANGYYEITTKFDLLKDDILYLARSLGFAAYAKRKTGTIKSLNFTGQYWRIGISGDVDRIPCKVERKKAKPRQQKKSVLRTGFSVEKIGEGDYYGFEIDGDGRFLLGDFTVTHNTHIGARYAVHKIMTNPETIGLIGANTYDQLSQSTCKPFFEYLNKQKIPFTIHRRPPAAWGIDIDFPHYRNIMCFPNGKVILLRSFDNFESLEGLTIGWAWIDETRHSDPEVWNIILRRLRCVKSHKKEIKVTSTPNGEDWLFEEFSKSDKYQIIFMSTEENPFLDEAYAQDMKDSYDPLLAMQEVHGRIISHHQSRVYHQFRTSIHVKDKWDYDPDRPILMGWDFNASDAPMALVLHQEFYNPMLRCSEIQAFDEIVQDNSNTPKVMEEVLKRYADPDTGIYHRGGWTIYGDAYGKRSTTGQSDYQVIKDYLYKKFPSSQVVDKSKSKNPLEQDRINAVNLAMMNANKVTRYYVSPKCKALVTDYKKVTPLPGGGIDKKKDIKLSHPSDASGYVVQARMPAIKKKFGSISVTM